MIETIDRVTVDPESISDPVVRRIRALLPAEKVLLLERPLITEHKGMMTPEQFDASKKWIHVTRFKGQFFKRCPGATQKRALTCCNYFVLNLGQQCNMNCSYCYLQSYLNFPATQIYSNIDQAIDELREMATQYPDHPYRVGTGEVIDSLSLDPITQYSSDLLEFANEFPNWMIEFKTKSAAVDQFCELPHKGNVIVSWSINPASVIDHEEHQTARLEERLVAARKVADRGFPVAFHIDPMIYHPNWKQNYTDLVDRIAGNFRPDEIHVFSVGTLRFQPEQKRMMRQRFGMRSWVNQAEMHTSEGGKMRYDADLRADMTRTVIERIRFHGRGYKSFICMETPENWIKSYDGLPATNQDLKPFFKPLPRITKTPEL